MDFEKANKIHLPEYDEAVSADAQAKAAKELAICNGDSLALEAHPYRFIKDNVSVLEENHVVPEEILVVCTKVYAMEMGSEDDSSIGGSKVPMWVAALAPSRPCSADKNKWDVVLPCFADIE